MAGGRASHVQRRARARRPVIQAVLLVFAIVFVLANLVTDLVTAALNPQARAGIAGGIGS